MNWPKIWQAPTGSIAGPELCAEVVNAGGVGAMGLTWTEPEKTRRWVEQVVAASDGLFLVNYALAFEPVGLTAALEAGAPMISFSWGDAAEYVDLVRSFGAKLGIQVVSREGVERACALGADFLICQGIEAGGHVESDRPLTELLPEVVEAAGGIPVIAAGGFADASDVRWATSVGASGAMFGTRFVASEESRAHPDYKRSLVENSVTELTMCFDGGWSNAKHRVLPNRTLETWKAAGSPPTHRPGEGDIVASLGGAGIERYSDAAPQIGMSGAIGEMCLYAGGGCSRITSILPAREIVKLLSAPD